MTENSIKKIKKNLVNSRNNKFLGSENNLALISIS